jgi:hypothetical protein
VTSRLLLVVAAVAMFSSARAGTIYVDASNCPGPGDGTGFDPYCSIHVAPGAYVETINFWGKAVYLHSSAGAAMTIIHGLGSGPVVRCDSGEGPGTVLEGFTVMGGVAPEGAGMFISGASPTVTDCTFTANEATNVGGGGMWVVDGNPTLCALTTQACR